MTGEMTWFEMGVPDVAQAQRFYGDLLQWTFESMGDSGAVITTPGGLAGSTLATRPARSSPTSTSTTSKLERKMFGSWRSRRSAESDEPGFGRFVQRPRRSRGCVRSAPAALRRARRLASGQVPGRRSGWPCSAVATAIGSPTGTPWRAVACGPPPMPPYP